MPQRVSDVALTRLLEFHAESRYSLDLALDLRDERVALKIAVEALEFYADRDAYSCTKAQTALGRIKGMIG